MGRRLATLVLALIGLALGAGEASAATLFVDDDKADCPQAAFQRVQAAVDAAKHDDTVRVCRGTYREQVVVPKSKTGLELRSDPDFAAILRSPSAGMTVRQLVPLAIVVIRAQRVHLRGFRIEGPLVMADPAQCNQHLHPAGVAVPQGSVWIGSNRITGTVVDCGGSSFGSGVHTGDVGELFCCEGGDGLLRVTVADSETSGTSHGVIAEGRGELTVLNSVLTGRGSDPGGAGVLSFDRFSSGFELRTHLEGNRISRFGRGVEMGFVSRNSRIVSNRIEDNGAGVLLGEFSQGTVNANLVLRNVRGIWVPEAVETDFNILGNTVRDSGSFGIVMEGAGARLRNNTSLRSGELDCFDPSPSFDGNTWINNIGATSSPRDLCRPPG